MPIVTCVNSIVAMRKFGVKMEGEGFSTFDAAGRLVPEIDTILAMVKKYDMILASGHLPPAEGMRLFIATMLRSGLKEQEIETMVKTNPAWLLGLDERVN